MSSGAITANPQVEFQHYLQEDQFLSNEEHLTELTLALYRQLGNGAPVTLSALASELNLSVSAVNNLVSELPKSTIDTDPNDAIVAFGGLSQVPANHLFLVEGRKFYTWCVFDALFLPQLLEKSATFVTQCPITQQSIEIKLAPTAVTSAQPAQPVMSIVAPSREACCDNLRDAFCDHINFFADEEAYRLWSADRLDVSSVTLKEAQNIANLRNDYRYGGYLRAA